MRKELLPHQIEDARFMADRKFAGNFSSMGSGKTIATIEACQLVKARRVIVVCPPIAMNMWAENFKEQLDWTAQLVKTGVTPIDLRADVLILSYDIATRRHAELAALRADVLICDESHALKSIKAKRTVAMLGLAGLAGLAGSVGHAWMLTGTPVTRHNDDIYSFVARGDLQGLRSRCGGTGLERFWLRYCVTQRKQFGHMRRPVQTVVGSRNTAELNAWLFEGAGRLAVRRELAEVWAAMPPLTTNRLTVRQAMTPELRAMMALFEAKSQKDMEQLIARNDESLATLRRKLGESKVAASVEEIAERAESGAGALLVGAWHTSVIDALASGLTGKGLKVMILDGRTSPARKTEAERAFNAQEIDVLIGQIAAMGVAINLQHGGNRIVVVEEDWSRAIMDQFYARLHRIGQTQHVHVDIFVTDTKLDQAVSRIASAKASNAAKLLDQGEAA